MKFRIFAYLFLSYTACGQSVDKSQKTSHAGVIDTIPKQVKMMSDYSPTFEKAHPNARHLMAEDFYFSPIDETVPFSNDDGADTYAGFKDWRLTHKSDNPKAFLLEQLDR